MKHGLLLLLVMGLCATVHGQPPPGSMSPVDTLALVQRFSTASTDTARISASRALVKAARADHHAFRRWSDTLFKYAARASDTTNIMFAHVGRAMYHMIVGDQHAMIEEVEAELVYAEARKDHRTVIEARTLIARGLVELGDLESALIQLFKNTATAQEHGLQPEILDLTYYMLGEVYQKQEEHTKAIENYERCIAVTEAVGKGGSRKQLALLALSATYRALGQPLKAQEQLARYGAIRREAQAPTNEEELLLESGLVQLALGQRDSALVTLRRCLVLTDTTQFYLAGLRTRLALAPLVSESEGAKLLQEARAIALPRGLLDDVLQADRALLPLLRKQGKLNEASVLAEEALQLSDSLSNERKNRAVQQMKVRYETDLKDKEIASLQQEKDLQAARAGEQQLRIQRQQQTIIGAALIGVLLLIASLLAYRAFRLKRKAAAALELKNAEVLRQKERAEESEKAKDRFLANVSHEVRTPLNAIMGFTGLLMHEAKDERSARFLGNIRDAGDNLLVVINDVLDLSRIEAGRLHLVKEPFDLHRCLRLCTEILQHRAAEQRNELLLSIAAGTPPWILGDSARLTQIVLNLAGNALKFTTNGTVRIRAMSDDGKLVLVVEDTGIGIPADKLAAVFERFTQVNDTDQRRFGGTGLGLSIVKELVQLHKGEVAVESQPGEGTRFTVRLPLAPAEAPSTEALPERTTPLTSLAGRTVLLAEDNDMNALVTEETLARSFPHARVERVVDGLDVVERMRAGGGVALILMDVQMPQLDGIAATRLIRAMEGPASNVPIIALTASVLPNDLSRCIDAGMDACVPKPFKASELLAAIERLTGDRASAVPKEPEGDMLRALFRRMVPDRLKALKEARARGDREKMLRVVHSLRPQLVHHDGVRFGPLCDGLLALSTDAPDWDARFEAFTLTLEQALAELR